MFAMTIVFGTSQAWTLLFKTNEAFNDAIIALKNPSTFDNKDFDFIDDYGQHACIKRDAIQGVMFEDMSKSKLAHIERGLHQMRTNIEANNMGKADPSIAAFMRGQMQQPGVITPFSPNGAFRQ